MAWLKYKLQISAINFSEFPSNFIFIYYPIFFKLIPITNVPNQNLAALFSAELLLFFKRDQMGGGDLAPGLVCVRPTGADGVGWVAVGPVETTLAGTNIGSSGTGPAVGRAGSAGPFPEF